MCNVTLTLMTSAKQSNGRRIDVELYSSCNSRGNICITASLNITTAMAKQLDVDVRESNFRLEDRIDGNWTAPEGNERNTPVGRSVPGE